MTLPTRGAWIDDAPALVRTSRFWDDFVAHGLTVGDLMLESNMASFDPKYSVDSLLSIAALAKARHVELVLTVWAEPNKQYMEDFELKIGAYILASGATALCFDEESNWTKGRLAGYATMNDAAFAWAAMVGRLKAKFGVRIEITTFMGHTENTERAMLTPHADIALPQAYSVYMRADAKGVDQPVPWDGRLGPGSMQRATLAMTGHVVGVKEGRVKLSIGLAAYDQKWPEHTAQEALQVAFDAAQALGVTHCRYWSTKWIFGGHANGYASAFLKGLTAHT